MATPIASICGTSRSSLPASSHTSTSEASGTCASPPTAGRDHAGTGSFEKPRLAFFKADTNVAPTSETTIAIKP